MHRVPNQCPVCGESVHITKIECRNCGSELSGNFTPCKFCMLEQADLNFLEIFVKNRGNIKDVEREMGVSYPTVRNNLDHLLQVLGYTQKKEEKWTKKEILLQLANQEISANEAMKRLKECETE